MQAMVLIFKSAGLHTPPRISCGVRGSFLAGILEPARDGLILNIETVKSDSVRLTCFQLPTSPLSWCFASSETNFLSSSLVHSNHHHLRGTCTGNTQPRRVNWS